jgi:TonB family protein
MLSPRHLLALLAMVACMLQLVSALHAQQIVASAVDTSGKRHLGSREFPGLTEPWIHDRVKFVAPEYPYDDRAKHHQGDGLFRISIDVKTGLITRVSIVKSTGFRSFDTSAVTAIRKWRWKPGTWREVDIPIRFTMAGHR